MISVRTLILQVTSNIMPGEAQLFPGRMDELSWMKPVSHSNRFSKKKSKHEAEHYWDLFMLECVAERTGLMQKGWIDADDVTSADPAVVLSLPAVAALRVLANSVVKEHKDKSAIVWSGGQKCNDSTRPQHGHIVELLWLKIMAIRRLLASEKGLAKEANVTLLTARILSNGSDASEALKSFLQRSSEKDRLAGKNQQLFNLLTDLSVCMSRLRPFKERLPKLFDLKIIEQCIETAV